MLFKSFSSSLPRKASPLSRADAANGLSSSAHLRGGIWGASVFVAPVAKEVAVYVKAKKEQARTNFNNGPLLAFADISMAQAAQLQNSES